MGGGALIIGNIAREGDTQTDTSRHGLIEQISQWADLLRTHLMCERQ